MVGNWCVLSLPLRDQSRTAAPPRDGSTSTMARIPSYFGSYTSPASTSGASASVASMGLGAAIVRVIYRGMLFRRKSAGAEAIFGALELRVMEALWRRSAAVSVRD